MSDRAGAGTVSVTEVTALQRYAHRLEALHEIDRAILAADSAEDIARAALPRVRRLIPGERGSLVLFDRDRGVARYPVVDMNGLVGPGEGSEVPLDQFPPPAAFAEAGILHFPDIREVRRAEFLTPALDRMLAAGIRSVIAAPLMVNREPVGILSLSSTTPGRFSEEHEEIVGEVAAQLAIALQHARMREQLEHRAAELEHRVEELRQMARERGMLLTRLVTAQEEERKRVAGDIHDDSVQVMAAVGMRLSMLRRKLSDSRHLEEVAKLEDAVQTALTRLRRLMFELRPPELDRDGLIPALRLQSQGAAEEAGLVLHIDDRLSGEPDPEARALTYRIVQEAVTNVRKHASAKRVDVLLEERAGGVHVEVRDDGVGFPEGPVESPHGHLGLTAMRERAEIAGGWCRVYNLRTGGACVEFWIPAGLAEPRPGLKGVPTRSEGA